MANDMGNWRIRQLLELYGNLEGSDGYLRNLYELSNRLSRNRAEAQRQFEELVHEFEEGERSTEVYTGRWQDMFSEENRAADHQGLLERTVRHIEIQKGEIQRIIDGLE